MPPKLRWSFSKFGLKISRRPSYSCDGHSQEQRHGFSTLQRHWQKRAILRLRMPYYALFVHRDQGLRSTARTSTELLQEWLLNNCYIRAVDWFELHWCGPWTGRGRLAHSPHGIGITAIKQGLDSTWRWDRNAISRGHGLKKCKFVFVAYCRSASLCPSESWSRQCSTKVLRWSLIWQSGKFQPTLIHVTCVKQRALLSWACGCCRTCAKNCMSHWCCCCFRLLFCFVLRKAFA